MDLSGPLWASPASQPGKRMTGLFYPRSTSLGLSGPLWAVANQKTSSPARTSLSQSKSNPASQPASLPKANS